MVSAFNRGADHLPKVQITLLAKAPNQEEENEMKRLITLSALTWLLAFASFASPKGGKCAVPGVTVSPTTIAFGGTIQVTGHFTNCGGSNLTNVNAQMLVVNPCLPGGPTNLPGYQDLLYTYIPSIGPGQTVSITVDYTPTCNDGVGDWEAQVYMRTRGNGDNLLASTHFTVMP